MATIKDKLDEILRIKEDILLALAEKGCVEASSTTRLADIPGLIRNLTISGDQKPKKIGKLVLRDGKRLKMRDGRYIKLKL